MVKRWDIITIGNLSRNRYWGEPEDQPRRPTLCTCTLIRTNHVTLLVDPSLADAQAMARELDRRVGLKPGDIDHVFITHAHDDHHDGLKHLAHARWLAAGPVAEALNRCGHYHRTVESAPEAIDDVQIIATPGHTLDHHSLRFLCDGAWVVVAGDAVMTRDFWRERSGHFNSADPNLVAQTIDRLANLADFIVPGHDNYFAAGRRSSNDRNA